MSMTLYPPIVSEVPELKHLLKQFISKRDDIKRCIDEHYSWRYKFDANDNNENKKLESSPISLPMISDMKYETNRLKSFEKGWPVSYIKPEDCASVGLYYLGVEDRVQCAFCNLIISDWKEGDMPVAEHVKHYPMCPFLLRQDVGNIPISGLNGLQQWQVQNARPERSPMQFAMRTRFPSPSFQTKYPAMSSFDKRLQTFLDWPSNQTVQDITPTTLAESGLFYSGVADVVTCFCCGGQMGSWSPTDNPWIEHARHFPCCPFVKSIKGSAFIEEARLQFVSDYNSSNEVQEPSYSNVAAATNNFEAEGAESISRKEETVKELENNEANGSENKFLCKICMEMRTRVAFIPCGHSLACPTCSKELRNCPLCRKPITAAVKLFFD